MNDVDFGLFVAFIVLAAYITFGLIMSCREENYIHRRITDIDMRVNELEIRSHDFVVRYPVVLRTSKGYVKETFDTRRVLIGLEKSKRVDFDQPGGIFTDNKSEALEMSCWDSSIFAKTLHIDEFSVEEVTNG